MRRSAARAAAVSATEPTGGTASFRLCGDPVPSGASYVSGPRLGPTTAISDGDPKANIEAVLRSEGWEVDDVDNELRLVARRDGILLLGDVAPSGANLTFTADCVDAPADLARELANRPSTDVALAG